MSVNVVTPFRPYRQDDTHEAWAGGLDQVLAELRMSRDETHNIRHNGRMRLVPSSQAIAQIVDKLAAVLFPMHYGQADLNDEAVDAFVEITLRESLALLTDQVARDLLSAPHPEGLGQSQADAAAADIVRSFAAQLPTVRATVVSDLRAAFAGDPAATSLPEIMLGYPGLLAVLYHRLARVLYLLGARLVARLIAHIAHSRTAIDIHPGATIGHSFFIDHGTGVVIGETTIIGDRVRLYQAVTLGAKSFRTDEEGRLVKGHERHPILEDDVVIYAGATVLGRVTIGKGSVIGGNVWLTRSVPRAAGSRRRRCATSIAEIRTALNGPRRHFRARPVCQRI